MSGVGYPWQLVRSEDGQLYYWNPLTNESQWDPPSQQSNSPSRVHTGLIPIDSSCDRQNETCYAVSSNGNGSFHSNGTLPSAHRENKPRGEKEGFLLLQSGLTWKKYWFVLQQDKLNYYKESSCLKLKGSIDVSGALVDRAHKLTKSHAIHIVREKKHKYLAANSQEDQSSWLSAICRGRTSTQPEVTSPSMSRRAPALAPTTRSDFYAIPLPEVQSPMMTNKNSNSSSGSGVPKIPPRFIPNNQPRANSAPVANSIKQIGRTYSAPQPVHQPTMNNSPPVVSRPNHSYSYPMDPEQQMQEQKQRLQRQLNNVNADPGRGRAVSEPKDLYSLPPNWSEHKTPEGYVYYWNRITNAASWEFPVDLSTSDGTFIPNPFIKCQGSHDSIGLPTDFTAN